MRALLILAAVLMALALPVTLAPPAAALDAGEMLADPAQEARARDIGRQLRCLVCSNQSIFDSNAGVAKDLRNVVRERITAGDTDAEAIDYVAARYGDYVLLNPPLRTTTLILWLSPFVLAVLGAVFAFLYLRRPPAAALATDEEDVALGRTILSERQP